MSLSAHAEVVLYSVQTIKTCSSLPPAVDVRTILLDRTTRFKHFFTLQSREAQCIVATHLQPKFWKSIDKSNRATEQRTGKLKGQSITKLVKIPIT